MLQTDALITYGPLAIITVALMWGIGRILYLSLVEKVTVVSFLARKKTPAEIGLGVIAVILDGYLVFRPFIPTLDTLVFAQTSPLPVFGLILMALAIGLMILCQIDMGKSWRIGIPEEIEESQSLITGGVYGYSRNPIYVAILVFLIGAAVLVPGPLTILSVIGTYLLLGPVVQREETFMEKAFGDEFRHYKKHVRRWI